MIRRFNFTGRVSIPRDHVLITITPDGTHHRIDASIDLKELELPRDGLIALEAYHQNSAQRFDWGTVSDPRPPANRYLSEFSEPKGVRFRLKVIHQNGRVGAIAGEVGQLRPRLPGEGDAGRRSLLPVGSDDLEGEPWRVDFTSTGPLLKIDKRLGRAEHFARREVFQALVYPAVVKIILLRLVEEMRNKDREDAEGWLSDWLLFVDNLKGMTPIERFDEAEECDQWVRHATAAFSTQNALLPMLAKYVSTEGDS